jgi:3-phosphoshikimate 1-carboxyvinyltransferase
MNVQNFIAIRPRRQINAEVSVPGSKSITNRALLLAALCEGKTVLEGVLNSEDTLIMFSALQQLGLDVSHQPENCRMIINGTGGVFPNKNADIYIGNSGTSVRFLAAALAFADGHYRLFGKERMESRPIIDLVRSLQQLGADIYCGKNNNCPPLVIEPADKVICTEDETLETTVAGNISSQYLSALLMSSPLIRKIKKCRNIKIAVEGTLVSIPYIEMTLTMMQSFGVNMDGFDRCLEFTLPEKKRYYQYYQSPKQYFVEPDASAASYFFAAAAVCGGKITVSGLSRNSLQGDVRFVNRLKDMGCKVHFGNNAITVERDLSEPLRGGIFDMNEISDTAQTLAVAALFADEPVEIIGVEHIRYKETDRIGDLSAELRKFGAEIELRQDGLKIIPPKCRSGIKGELKPATVETYDDHRMAMSFAVAGLRLPGTVILEPQCCAKTFPEFFTVLEKL